MADAPKTFWHPLKLWEVLLIFLAAQIVCNLATVPLREGLGWPLPQWVGGGLGGFTGVLATQWLARRRRG